MIYSGYKKRELINLMNDAERADNWHLWGHFHDIFKELFGYNPFCDTEENPPAKSTQEG